MGKNLRISTITSQINEQWWLATTNWIPVQPLVKIIDWGSAMVEIKFKEESNPTIKIVPIKKYRWIRWNEFHLKMFLLSKKNNHGKSINRD